MRARIIACALAVSLFFGCSLAAPCSAIAEVRKADVVMGETVESRGLTIAQCPNVSAQFVFVMDANGTVYFERDSQMQTKIASITKVMTCIVALDYGVSTDKIVVSSSAAAIGESSANLQEGDVLDFISCLKALMVPSGNDAALALSEYYGAKILSEQGVGSTTAADCVSAFVRKMNEKAAEIGMTDSVFANPHGLDDGAYAGDLHSTAHDVGLMVQYGMRNKQFREVCGIDGCEISVQRDGSQEVIYLEPTDTLLSTYDGALGVKTGFTNSAGACFAGASARNGHEVYAIILNATDEQARFDDAETCMDWVYNNFVSVPLANSQTTASMSLGSGVTSVPVVAFAAHPGWVNCTFPVTFENPDASVEVFRLNGNITQEIIVDDISGDIKPGQKVGVMKFYQRNVEVASVNLISCSAQSGPNFFQAIGVAVDRFLRGSDQPTVAKSQIINELPILMSKKQ